MSVPQPLNPSNSFKNSFSSINSSKPTFSTRMHSFLRLKVRRKERRPPQNPVEMVMDRSTMCSQEDSTSRVAGKMEGRRGCKDDSWKAALQKAVKSLHFGRWDEKEAAAEEIERLAAGGDLKSRKIMVEYGVIPPLVDMVGSVVVARRISAVRALTELTGGSFTNKALMVEAGILSKLPENIIDIEITHHQDFARLILSLSSLANSQFALTPTRIIHIVVTLLESSSTNMETKESCLNTIHNLSSVLDNAGQLIQTGVVKTLLDIISTENPASEKALSILANLVVTIAGRTALEHDPMVPEGLIEIMTWEEKPKCQELSAYILMVLAHSSYMQRQKMSKAGIVQVLLEVALLGSPLAQKRALKTLQWFKNEQQMRTGMHSGPQMGTAVWVGSPVNRNDTEEGKTMMKRFVKQSLYKNMETITRRANGGDSSTLKTLVISSSSKSLPY